MAWDVNKRIVRPIHQHRSSGSDSMRAFLVACIVAIILAIGGVLMLGAVQKSSGEAFSTEGARINPSWGWRQMFGQSTNNGPVTGAQSNPDTGARTHAGPEDCQEISAYRWMFADFGKSHGNEACAVSQ